MVSTFARDPVGDLTAITLGLGYFGSAILPAVIGAIAVAHVRFGLNPIVAFWAAYVVTRPLGASVADWLAKAPSAGGLGFGGGPVSLVLASAIAVLVGPGTSAISPHRRPREQISGSAGADASPARGRRTARACGVERNDVSGWLSVPNRSRELACARVASA